MFKVFSLLLQQYHKPQMGRHGGLLVPSRQKLSKDFCRLRDSRRALTTEKTADEFLPFLVSIFQRNVSYHDTMSDRDSY